MYSFWEFGWLLLHIKIKNNCEIEEYSIWYNKRRCCRQRWIRPSLRGRNNDPQDCWSVSLIMITTRPYIIQPLGEFETKAKIKNAIFLSIAQVLWWWNVGSPEGSGELKHLTRHFRLKKPFNRNNILPLYDYNKKNGYYLLLISNFPGYGIHHPVWFPTATWILPNNRYNRIIMIVQAEGNRILLL